MKKLQVFIPIFLIFIMLYFSGCTAQPDSAPPTSLSSTLTPVIALKATQLPTITPVATDTLPDAIMPGVEIKFWHPWSGEMANLAAEMTNEFNETNAWGMKVITEFHADENVLIADTNQAFIDGTPPELIVAPDYYLHDLEESGVRLQNLDNFIESPVWGYSSQEVSDFLPAAWGDVVSTGKRVGVPAYRSAHLIFYNQTWASELGFKSAPANPLEFQTQTCAAGAYYLNDRDLDNNGTGGWVYSYDPTALYSWLYAFGGGVVEGEDRFVLEENSLAGGYLYDLFVNDCAWIGRQPQPYLYFANRQALAYSGKMEDILTQERVNAINKTDDLWSVLPYPADSNPQLFSENLSFAIPASSEEKALAAWVFIQWMLKTDNQVRIIETSGTLPLSDSAIEMLDEYKVQHPVWDVALQYLPIIQSSPDHSDWGAIKKIFADISWKLIQYTTSREDIPVIFYDAQNLLEELSR